MGTALLAILGLTVATWAQLEQQPEKVGEPRQDNAKPADKPSSPDAAKPDKGQRDFVPSSKGFIEKYDRNGDGYLDKEELPAEMRDSFLELDLNKDGKLTAGELERHARRMERSQNRQRPIDMITIWIVENRDTQVGLPDLQKAYEMLRKLDRDNDGELTREEFETGRFAALQAKLEMMMQYCDRNKDGRISKDEAHEHVGQRFEQFDQNRDGFLDRSEVEQALKQHKAATGPRDSDARETERKEDQGKDTNRKPVDR